MRKRIKKGASLGCDGKSLRNFKAASINRKSTHAQDKTIRYGLHSLLANGIISATSPKTGRRLGGLHCHTRRLIAAPLRGVFLLVVNRTHGVDMPIILTGAPYGNPFGLLFPCGQSANLYGVAHPLGGGVGFTTDNLTQGKRAMSKPLNGAIAHTHNTAFVSPYFEKTSPLGKCLKDVTDDCTLDALEAAKTDYQTFQNQIADVLSVIAERENLARLAPSDVSYSDVINVAGAIDLMASLVRLSADMGLAIDQRINQKMEGKQ